MTKSAIELPGIDDCDWLYTMSSRSGDSSVYFHIHTVDEKIYAQLSVDSNAPEGANFCQDLTSVSGPYASAELAALDLLPYAKEWFWDNHLHYVYDNYLRKIARRVK